jgi:FMN reductase
MPFSGDSRPLILGLGGTFRERSSTGTALDIALRTAESLGAHVVSFGSSKLALPLYNPEDSFRSQDSQDLVSLFERCDGMIVAAPSYHGSISGSIKNALDYTEDLIPRGVRYLEGKPIGCIGGGAGWQGAVGALQTLRTIGHALRGWPTPMGVALNTANRPFGPNGDCTDEHLQEQLELVATQVVSFVLAQRSFRESRSTST